METIFTHLHNLIVAKARAAGILKKETVSKAAMLSELETLSMRYKILLGGIQIFTPQERQKLTDRIYMNKGKSSAQGCAAYINIAAKTANALPSQRLDAKFAFKSIEDAATIISRILNEFIANIDIVFEGSSTVNIQTAKLSTLALFEFVEKAELYREYAGTLISIITYELVETNGHAELNKPLPYKYELLNKKYDTFLTFHIRMAGTDGSNYMDSFKNLRKSMDDIRVANADGESNLAMVDTVKLEGYARNLFGFNLNPFRWLGEQWNLIKDSKIRKMEAEKETIVAHVSLLQMALADMDPNSPEYQAKVKVIEAYNNMVREMDKKINQYFGDDN